MEVGAQCSLYLLLSNSPTPRPGLYIKLGSSSVSADWYHAVGASSVGNVSVSGDLDVTGTVTAGDLVSEAG